MSYYKADQAELISGGQAHRTMIQFIVAIRTHNLTEAMRSYHRAEFLDILQKRIPASYRTHFGKRLVSYKDSSSEPIVLHFKDGTTAKCDILVGADGIKSAVRKQMFTDLATKAQDEAHAAAYRGHIDAKWSGVVTYRGLIQADTFKTAYPNHNALSGPVCVSVSAL